ncbi:hypothetical protein ACFL6C_05520 [Myxococcota bacterium]
MQHVGDSVFLWKVDGIEFLNLSALDSAASSLTISEFPRLRAIALPQLVSVAETLLLSGNPSLETIGVFESVQSIGALTVRDNPLLPTCQVNALLEYVTGSVRIEGNDDPCDPDPCTAGACVMDCSVAENYVCN